MSLLIVHRLHDLVEIIVDGRMVPPRKECHFVLVRFFVVEFEGASVSKDAFDVNIIVLTDVRLHGRHYRRDISPVPCMLVAEGTYNKTQI